MDGLVAKNMNCPTSCIITFPRGIYTSRQMPTILYRVVPQVPIIKGVLGYFERLATYLLHLCYLTLGCQKLFYMYGVWCRYVVCVLI